MLNTALDYIDRGWSVIPLSPREKIPLACVLPVKMGENGQPELTRNGRPRHTWEPYQRRQPTEEEVHEWFQLQPRANLGIVTGGVSGIIVQDLDGPEGLSTAQLNGVPHTPMSRTGHGMHVVYRHPGYEVRNFARRAPGVDLRGDGGYIVAPPSIHPSGHTYEWQVEPSTPLAMPPDWFVDMLTPDPADQWLEQTLSGDMRSYLAVSSPNYWTRALASELTRLAEATVGNRNNTLVKAAYRMGQIVGGGHLPEEEVESKLTMVAIAIGLADGEIRRTIRSGLNAGMLNPRR